MTVIEADATFSLKITHHLADLAKGVGMVLEYGSSAVKLLLKWIGCSEDLVDNIAKAVNEGRLAVRRQEFKRYEEFIGQTHLVDITRLADTKVEGVKILAKTEFLNPGFSMKDRIVQNIFNKAESAGQLKPGGTVVAASSGNTGASVAMLAAARGYEAIIFTSPKCSQEKRDAITAYGARLEISGAGLADNDPQSYMNMAKERALTHGYFDVDQYDNPDNVDAHYQTMGPEIWQQTGGRVTHFVAGGSTGGTISGTGKFLKEMNSKIVCTLADPEGSIFGHWKATEQLATPVSFLVEGVGKGSIPGCMDFKVIDNVIKVDDTQAFKRCHELAQKEGLMVGGSAGLNVEAAIQIANSVQEPAVIVTVLCDLGVKYLSKVFNRTWLDEKGIYID